MNDRELAAKLDHDAGRLINRSDRVSAEISDDLYVASRRITELSREVATYLALEVEAAALAESLDKPGGWLAVPDYEYNATAAARRLVDMGLWEENPTPTNPDTVEVRPVKGTP